MMNNAGTETMCEVIAIMVECRLDTDHVLAINHTQVADKTPAHIGKYGSVYVEISTDCLSVFCGLYYHTICISNFTFIVQSGKLPVLFLCRG